LPTKDVVTCFLEYRGKVLILRRSQKVGTYRGKWAAVSGYIEKEPDEQAFAEILEETGLQADEVNLLRKGEVLEAKDETLGIIWRIHPYLFHVKEVSRMRIDWEHTDSRWINPSEIVNFETVPRLTDALKRVWRGSLDERGSLEGSP